MYITESVVYGFLEHFKNQSFCGVIHDRKLHFRLQNIQKELPEHSNVTNKILQENFSKVNKEAKSIFENFT